MGRESRRSVDGSRAADHVDISPGLADAVFGLVVLAQPEVLPQLWGLRPDDPPPGQADVALTRGRDGYSRFTGRSERGWVRHGRGRSDRRAVGIRTAAMRGLLSIRRFAESMITGVR